VTPKEQTVSVAAVAPAPDVSIGCAASALVHTRRVGPEKIDGFPRPAAQAPRLLRAIPTDPPRDDEPGGIPSPAALGAEVLPFALHPSPVPTGISAPPYEGWTLPAAAAPVAPGRAARATAVDDELREIFGPQRTPRAALPEPGPRAAAAVRVLLEVLVGDRPAYQVARWVSPALLCGLERRCPTPTSRRARRPLLHSLHISEPADSVAEVAAVISTGQRYRAVALRLEGRDGRWTVTALRVG